MPHWLRGMQVSECRITMDSVRLGVLCCLLASSQIVLIPRASGSDALVDLLSVLNREEDIPGQDVYADTTYGQLRGRRRNHGYRQAGGTATTIDWFLGIQYAAPPTEYRRFREPEEPMSWSGVRNATRFGAVCPQFSMPEWYLFDSKPMQDEDCLYLNVFSPFQGKDATYPVLVYIHGGSYRTGTGNTFLGHVLAQYGIVVVTINYRLDVLGFLCSKDDGVSGNMGILDQIRALQWVQDNIAGFRGDPQRVTVAGNSAGSWSVCLLSVTPLAKGLFHSAIQQSGSLLSQHAVHEPTADLRAQLVQLADAMGCDVKLSKAEMLHCMRAVNWQKTVIATWEQPKFSPDGSTNLRPCLDDHVMPSMPKQLLSDPSNPHVSSVMIGGTRHEWGRNLAQIFAGRLQQGDIDAKTYQSGRMNRTYFEKSVRTFSQETFSFGPEVTDAILYDYTNWTNYADETEIRRQYVDMLTDFEVVAPNVLQANLYFNASIPVYAYTIEHHSALDNEYPSWTGSYHEMELNYIFGAPFLELDLNELKPQQYTEADRLLSQNMMRWWSNYVKVGNPTPNSRDNDPEWRRYFPSTSDYYYISAEYTEMRSHFRTKKVAFWNQLIPALAKGGYVTNGSGTTDGNSGASIRMEVWILGGLCLVLLIMALALTGCVLDAKRRYRKQMKTCQLLHGGIITLKFDES